MATEKRILLLGAGYVAQPCAEHLLRCAENRVTVACRTLAKAQALCPQHARAHAVSLDVGDAEALAAAVRAHDLVISLVPYTHHAAVIRACIDSRRCMVTTSYISPAMAALHAECEAAGITVLNEIGLDPGIDHLYALKTIWDVHDRGGRLDHFTSYCGGLPAPECSNNPLGYKFSWSARGVLLAARNEARYIAEGKPKVVPGPLLMTSAQPIETGYRGFAFVGYANRDSTPYTERYGIPEAQTIVRGTLRYKGFPEFMQAMATLGMLDDAPSADLAQWAGKPWHEFLAHHLQCSPDTLESTVRSRVTLDPDHVVRGLAWLGMLPNRGHITIMPSAPTLLDALCATLEPRMQYAPNERDLVFLQHRFECYVDGRSKTITATLVEYGNEKMSAMAKTVGVPCGVAAQLVLDGKITRRGVIAPMHRDIVFPLIEALEREDITMVEVEE